MNEFSKTAPAWFSTAWSDWRNWMAISKHWIGHPISMLGGPWHGLIVFVWFVTTHRLICSMTYLGHHVSLTWGQMLKYPFNVIARILETPRREEHDVVRITALAFLLQKFFGEKNHFFAKEKLFWPVFTYGLLIVIANINFVRWLLMSP